MASKEEQLEAMAGLTEGDPFAGGPEEPGEVLCQVCDTYIDDSTGQPLEPVTEETVAAVREYMNAAGQAEEGGVMLDLSAPPAPPV